jgi:hypothetical protein
MATDDDAAPKLSPVPPAPEPAVQSKDAPAASAPATGEPGRDKLNERLTERIRQGSQTTPPDDKLTESIRQRLEHLVPELVKKTFSAGMGAVFSTEEGIRKIAREVSLPDVVGYAASTADSAKDKVFEIVARETREFLSNLNLTEEIAKILTTLSFEIKTEIRFIPNSERMMGSEPDVKASVKLKKNDKAIGSDPKPEDADKDRESRSRLRFWRRDGEGPSEGGDDGDDSGHDR